VNAPGTTAVPWETNIAAAYALCREIARREAKNFYWAFRVLPRHKSDAMCAIYAFMRRADDISDDESKSLGARREEMAVWVDAWRMTSLPGQAASASRSSTILPASVADLMVFHAVRDTQHRFSIPDSLLEELVAGTTMDLTPPVADAIGVQTYATFDDLYRYCYLVASVVGLVSIRVFGYSDKRAEALAEETGIAFQLTNILRDVKEDIERGRLYIPLDLMEEFGETVPELHELAGGRAMTERERGMLATLAIRAERYYVAGRKLVPLLDRDSRAAMWVLMAIYHRLLGRIGERRMEVFAERITVPAATKLSILARGIAMAAWNRIVP
jgi:15-cis-phytoene synthase